MTMNSLKWSIVCISVFLYSVCFWNQASIVPYMSKYLGVDSVTHGYLETTFALVQLVGGPLFGKFGDVFGGKASMTLAFAASAVSCFLLGTAGSIPMLLISRLPGIFMQGLHSGELIATELGTAEHRADDLSKIAISYGLGIVAGPLMGGQLSKHYSPNVAAFFGCGVSLFCAVFLTKFIPKRQRKSTKDGKPTSAENFNFKRMRSLLGGRVLLLLLIRFVSSLPSQIFGTTFSIIATKILQLEPHHLGYLVSYAGFVTMAAQAFGVGMVTRRLNEKQILKWSTVTIALSFFIMIFWTTTFGLCVIVVPLVVSITFQNAIILSLLTKTAVSADTGVVIGFNVAVISLVRTISPTLGGYLLDNFGLPMFGITGFIMNVFVSVIIGIYI